MMLKIGSDYLDYSDSVEVQRKAKLFEDISTSDGDVSFQFEVQNTFKNSRLLTYPIPDSITKRVYNRIDCDLQDDSGVSLHRGFLRIESRTRDKIALSFFSGNSNWFGMITGNLSELDFSAYDVEQTWANIQASWLEDDGIVFPLIDHGGLITRSYPILKIEDFVGAFYVKTIFKKIFSNADIKLQGELFDEWRYQNLLCSSTSRDQSEIDDRSSYVLKDTLQVLPHNLTQFLTFDDDSTSPYYDGSLNLFDLANSRYLPDVKMNVRIEVTLTWHTTGTDPHFFVEFAANGVQTKFFGFNGVANQENVASLSYIQALEAGDDFRFIVAQTNDSSDAASILGGTIKITPTFIYKTNGSSAVPNWTSQQFVSNILRIFNVIAYYEPLTATLTLNLFEKLRDKTPIDLSAYIESSEVDYTEFISDYGQKSILSYEKVEFDELKQYNKGKILKYSQGVINVVNDFIPDTEEILTSEFCNGIGYTNAVFDASLEKTNLIELQEIETTSFSDVADDGSGNAAFNLEDDIFQPGDLIRIVDSTNTAYNGDWIVASIPAGHIVLTGVPFDTAATGTVHKLNFNYASDDNVFLFLNVPNYEISKFSGTTIYQEDSGPVALSNIAMAYFDLINTGRQVNDDFQQSLAFGSPDDTLRYQRTMVDDYFGSVARVLNDPVKIKSTALMPANVYRSIDFLRPAIIKTLDTSNLYYINLMMGYKSSYQKFRLDLIKLP